jgi:hypothetical protein
MTSCLRSALSRVIAHPKRKPGAPWHFENEATEMTFRPSAMPLEGLVLRLERRKGDEDRILHARSRSKCGQTNLWTACGHTPAMKARDMLPYYGTAIPSTCGLGSMISAEQA